MRWLVLIGVLSGVLPVAARGQGASDEGGPRAPVIDTIIIINRNVFDQREASSNFLFRVANAIHVTTRPSVVRNELLFDAGEPYDSARVAESARNLRRRALFRDVTIDTVRLEGRLAAVVETEDGWTTELQLNGRSTGGELTFSVGLLERNLLGTGTQAGFTFRDEPDRTATTVVVSQQRLGATRLAAAAVWDDLSDGIRRGWSFGVPFRAIGERSSVTLGGAINSERMLQFRNGEEFAEFKRRLFLQTARAAYAPIATDRNYLRVGVAGQIKREEFFPFTADGALVPDTVTGAVGVFSDLMRANFQVVTHFNGFDREEDVDLSTRVVLAAWLAPTAFGYERTGVGPSLVVQTGVGFGKNWVTLRGRANGLFTGAGLDSGRVRAELTAVSQALPRSATVFHIQGGARDGTPPGFEFDLGHGVGPRAFEPHAFTGTRAVWGSIEQRFFLVDEVLRLFGLGFAAYVDYGGAWFDDQPARAGGNIGGGIRFGATRSTGPNVGRIDLAYKFGDGVDGDRWVVLFGRGFEF